jgi:hypothetical protein
MTSRTFVALATGVGVMAALANVFVSCGRIESSLQTDGGSSVSANIGPAGGSITNCGARLDVPPGALSSVTTIIVWCDPGGDVPSYALRSPLYGFTPSGLAFAAPATVSIDFTGTSAGATIYWSQPSGADYAPLLSTVQGSRVIANINHFSTGFVSDAVDAGDADSDAGCVQVADKPTQGVPCGMLDCTGATSACCRDTTNDLTCVSPSLGICPDAGYSVVERCDGPEDCPNNQHCVAGPSSFCATSGGFWTICHADSDCPVAWPTCSEPQVLDSTITPPYELRTCTRYCSSDADCTWVSYDDSASGLDGFCYPDPGCLATCHARPPPQDAGLLDGSVDGSSDGGVDADSGATACVTPYTPGFISCGAYECNLQAQRCCTSNGEYCESYSNACNGFTLTCDGPEDCPPDSGYVCYASGQYCAPGPCLGGGLVQCPGTSPCACHSDSDCPGTFPYCYVNPSCKTSLPQCQQSAPPAEAGVLVGSCNPPDAGGPPNYGITCGGTTCTSPTDWCCMSASAGCQARSMQCTQNTLPMECDGPEDCPVGQICCGSYNPEMTYCTGQCGPTPLANAGDGRLCHTNQDCANNATCHSLVYYGGTFSVCY